MSNTIKAQIEFTNGKVINLDLYPDVAPLSVENFVELAKAGFYDGLCFHRVIPQFMIQGGGFVAVNGHELQAKNSAKTVKGEFKSNGVINTLKHEEGVISMARTQVKDSATSQFFICVATVPYLDGEYAAFGKTADEQSLKVAQTISRVETTSWKGYQDIPVREIVIKTVHIL